MGGGRPWVSHRWDDEEPGGAGVSECCGVRVCGAQGLQRTGETLCGRGLWPEGIFLERREEENEGDLHVGSNCIGS